MATRRTLPLATFALTVLLVVLRPAPVDAQATKAPPANGGGAGVPLGALGAGGITRRVPAEDYFQVFNTYYSGDYVTALRGFQSAAKGGVRSVDGQWIDSICYHSMLGECYYHMGNLPQALDQHTSALKLYLAYAGWMLKVDFPQLIEPAAGGSRVAIPWGNSTRATQLGRYPDTMQAYQGKTDAENAQAAQQGGVIAQLQAYPLYVVEIVRCIATSIRRRAEILGPTCPYDPLTTALVDTLSRRPAPPNHWSQCWIDVQLGLAYLSSGRREQAVAEFQKSLLAGGRFEHPLTSTSLLMLGQLMLYSEQYETAGGLFMEATYSASIYGHYDVMQEAFRGALTAHLLRGKKEPFAPLVVAAQWARRESVPLEASLLTLAAESFGAARDPVRGLALLAEARKVIGRHELSLGNVGAANQFELARLQFQTGNVAAGSTALGTALAFQAKSSRRLFQAALADTMFTSGAVTERVADQLYAELLREPRPEDWVRDPFDTLAVTMTPKFGALEHWMEAVHRKDPQRALEIADQSRRQRFHGSLPLGGRLLALRWLLGAPPEALPDRANQQRRDLLARYPNFVELANQAAELRAKLDKGELAPEDEEASKERADQLLQLSKISGLQEVILQDMAVERVAADAVFPPPLVVKDLQAKLPQGTLVFAYVATSRGITGVALNNEKFMAFPVSSPAKLRADVAELLKRIGNRDGQQPVDAKTIRDDSWKTIARRLLPTLTNDTPADAFEKIDELVIVPDGFLWYLPFETLLVGEGENEAPLLSKVKIRYAPTLGLAVPDNRPLRVVTRTAVVAGRMYPQDDLQLTIDAAQSLRDALPEAVKLPKRLPGPSNLIAKFCDRLVVYHDLDDEEKRLPYDWSPVQIDRNKPGSSLASYFPLPWGGPSQVVYPGFHTAADSGLKKSTAGGDEIFLSLCGLMSTGARSALISRWRVAGQSSFDITKEFVQELPHSPASSAWQRAVQLHLKAPLDPMREPRLRWPAEGDPPPSDHPFFWAGYLLADTGAQPNKKE